MDTRSCPLTPGMLTTLQTAVDHCTTRDDDLAKLLNLAPSTVHTQFRRICEVLGVRSRPAALILALRCGWITLAPPPAARDRRTPAE